jgi:hypothetical protein
MANKRRIFLAIYHRNELSLGENRWLRHSAFHWGIIISPKAARGRRSHAFDISDGVRLDPDNRIDLNSDRQWFFRAAHLVDPELSSHLLVRVMIGKLPHKVTIDHVESILASVPVPSKAVRPLENCVTWIKAAVTTLRTAGLVEDFNIEHIMDSSLGLAEDRMKNPAATPRIVNYTSRPM